MEIDIPGRGYFKLDYLVLDANGTISTDGVIDEGVVERLDKLAAGIRPVIITADTLGNAREVFSMLPVELRLLDSGPGAARKLDIIRSLGAQRSVAVGNGENDHLMLAEAAVGIAVIGREGASSKAAAAADVVVTDILAALDLLIHPLRLIATLRA